MKHDGWCARRVSRQALRLFSVEQHAAFLVTEHRALLTRVIAILDLRSHAGKLLAVLNQALQLFGAEAARDCHEVQGLEQTGFALAVVSGNHIEAWGGFELDLLQVTKRTRRDTLEANQRRHAMTSGASVRCASA